MLITNISLQNYRNLKDIHIGFKSRMTALVGGSATGKTSVFNAIDCIFEHGFSEGVLFTDEDLSENAHAIKVSVKYIQSSKIEGNQKYLIENHFDCNREWFDIEAIKNPENENLIYTKQFVNAQILMLNAGVIDEVFFNILDANLIGNFYEYAKLQHIKDAYTNLLKNAIPNCTNVSFCDVENEKKETVKTLQFEINGRWVRLDCLSKGFRKLAIMLTYIFIELVDYASGINTVYNFTGIVMIDNIEDNLDADMQRNIVPFLQSTFPFVQFIVATHSPIISQQLDKRNIVSLD